MTARAVPPPIAIRRDGNELVVMLGRGGGWSPIEWVPSHNPVLRLPERSAAKTSYLDPTRNSNPHEASDRALLMRTVAGTDPLVIFSTLNVHCHGILAAYRGTLAGVVAGQNDPNEN